MLEQALAALATSGPTALLAGMMVVVLWKKLQALQRFYEGDPGDAKTPATPGRIAEMVAQAQQREDKLRQNYEEALLRERDAQANVMNDLLNTLRGISDPS